MGNILPLLSSYKPPRNVAILPEEIVLHEILPKVPANSLIIFKCVSKKWLDHITNDTAFIEAHRRHHHHRSVSSIVLSKNGDKERDYRKRHKMFLLLGEENDDIPKAEELEMSYLLSNKIPELYEEINILGSSNGLVLISKSYHISRKDLILWNPATKEFRELPRPVLLNDNSDHGVDFTNRCLINFQSDIFDLGFDEETRDHKVVKVFETTWDENDAIEGLVTKSLLNFQVFSKNSDSWRSETITFSGYSLWSRTFGVSLNGDFCFLASQVTSGERHKGVILLFSYRSEEVQTPIDLPHCDDEDFRCKEYELLSWKEDSLALISPNHSPLITFDFWVMVKDNNNNNGFYWSRLFKFNYLYSICGVWRGELMLVQSSSCRRIELLLWDPKVNEKRGTLSLKNLDRLWYFSVAINYVPSLVSVHRK